MFKVETPANTDNFAAILAQAWENDKLNRALNDAAVLITGLTRGKIVAWSATNSRWELYNGTVAPEATTMIGIVEYVGSPDTSGGVRVTGVYLDEALTDNTAYYCQADGTLGTTETATFIGVCTDAGRLVMQGRGSGGSGSGASIGTGNYIAEPFSVVPGTGLEVLVNPNRCVIDETAVESASQTPVALTAKAAQLVFKKKDGTYDKLLPAMTAADLVDANTVGLWFPDGSASVPNAAVGVNGNTLAVANTLAKSGTITAVDGWAGGDAGKSNGTDGVMVSANSTGFPTGTAILEISVLYTHATEAGLKEIIRCDHFGYDILVSSSQELGLYNNVGAQVWTGYIFETGKTYLITKQVDGTKDLFYVNGQLVYTYAVSRNQSAAVIKPYGFSGYVINGTLHFVELRNALRTPAQIAALAQKLLIPCVYETGLVEFKNTNMSTRLEAAFDQTTAQGRAAAAYGGNVAFGRIGGRFSAPVGMQSVTVYGSTDYGFSYDNSHNVSMTLTLFGTNDWSSFTDVATQTIINGGSYWGTAQPVVTFNAPAGSYLYWGVKVALTSGSNCWPSVAEFAYTLSNAVKTDIRDALINPTESQIVTYCETSATGIKKLIGPNDPSGATPDWAYGIRVGPMGLDNKVKFLGYKYFSGSTQLYWDCPFDTRKIKTYFVWAEDATGRNQSDVQVGGNYVASGYGSTPAKAIACYIGSAGAAHFSGSYKTSGYIGVYCEVID